HPRIPGSDSTDPPGCERPEQPVTLEPDGEIVERWELPFDITSARVLRAVGSSGSVVRAEVVEARDRNELEFLDIYSTGAPEAAEARRGRAVWVETPAEAVVKREPDAQPAALSLGQLFDRLMEDAELRAWIEAQPADAWRQAALTPTFAALGDVEEQRVELRLITAEYERAALVSARHDGGGAELQLPGEEWRTRAFERRAATLPPGIRLIDEPDGYTPSDDLLLGELMLPSGRIAVGEFLFDEEELEIVVAAGSYPVHATLARYQGQEHDNVALATLILSPRQTVRWELAYTFPVDGGTATFVSAEGRDLLSGQLDADESAWRALDQEVFDSMMAHDYLGTEWQVDGGLNLVRVSSGVGDGGYPVYVGFDAGGQPTMVVVDFYLLHLAWPSG
ncbi:MAG TPA: DUF4241 domain-containing protein, partial [Candidatus Limnocylindria bacterium]|nr:DUF4241 domain-containing protein [Candidatus Limnocylindria bacterium]